MTTCFHSARRKRLLPLRNFRITRQFLTMTININIVYRSSGNFIADRDFVSYPLFKTIQFNCHKGGGVVSDQSRPKRTTSIYFFLSLELWVVWYRLRILCRMMGQGNRIILSKKKIRFFLFNGSVKNDVKIRLMVKAAMKIFNNQSVTII